MGAKYLGLKVEENATAESVTPTPAAFSSPGALYPGQPARTRKIPLFHGHANIHDDD